MIRWMFTHIDVSRSIHCAIHNLTEDLSGRASPDACDPPPCPIWLPAGVPHLTAVCSGPPPTEMAAFLLRSRSSVYWIVWAYRAGHLGIQIDPDGQLSMAVQSSILMPWLTRSLGALLKKAPRAYGWCRTRWSCATLAMTLRAKHGTEVSAATVRRWLHELGWVWKRAKLVTKDDDPHRLERLARIRLQHEHVGRYEGRVFADELDIHLLPKVGAAWMLQGTQDEFMMPGTHGQYSLAGALDLATGKGRYCLSPLKNNGLFRALLPLLDHTDSASSVPRISSSIRKVRGRKADHVYRLRDHF